MNTKTNLASYIERYSNWILLVTLLIFGSMTLESLSDMKESLALRRTDKEWKFYFYLLSFILILSLVIATVVAICLVSIFKATQQNKKL